MMANLFWPTIFIAIAVALTYLCSRVVHAKRRFQKWGGAGLAGLGAAAFGLVALLGIERLHARHAPVPDVKVAGADSPWPRYRASLLRCLPFQHGHPNRGTEYG